MILDWISDQKEKMFFSFAIKNIIGKIDKI